MQFYKLFIICACYTCIIVLIFYQCYLHTNINMLDHLRLRIPVFPTYTKMYGDNGTVYFTGDLLDLGLTLNGRSVARRDDGSVRVADLYAPYDNIGTDFSDMAVKFYHEAKNCLPALEIKASPIKLMQGHNAYGFDDIALGAECMLSLVCEAYPNLLPYLDFNNVEVLHLDATYFARLPHQNLIQPVIDFMSNISVGHKKPEYIKFDNYLVYSPKSRYLSAKVYGKYEEMQSQIKKLSGKAGEQAVNKLKALNKALPFANACLRFEARICKTYLVKNGYSSNLYALIEQQRQTPNFMQKLWGLSFNPIFSAMMGSDVMLKNYDDDKVLDLLLAKLTTIGVNGKRYESQAKNAFRFYGDLRQYGFVKCKKLYSKASFYDNLNNLIDCGFSRAFLQNLHSEKNNKVIPFVRLVEINFDEQLPADYITPKLKPTLAA